MRLGPLLTALGAEHDLPRDIEDETGANLLGITLFNGSRGVEQLAKVVDPLLRPRRPAVAEALWEGLVETGQNVEQHSGQRFGFVAAQLITGPKRVSFAVGDPGIGMLRSLRSRGASDDQQALEMALRLGVTETDDEARGAGLADVNACLQGLGGGLTLISGCALRTTVGDREPTVIDAHPFPGTLVQGIMRV
jgi:hypothetical protein